VLRTQLMAEQLAALNLQNGNAKQVAEMLLNSVNRSE